jgi:hypothetical protein
MKKENLVKLKDLKKFFVQEFVKILRIFLIFVYEKNIYTVLLGGGGGGS